MGHKSGNVILASVILLGASAAGVAKATWKGGASTAVHQQRTNSPKRNVASFADVQISPIGHLPIAKEGLSLATNQGKVYSIGGYTGTYSTSSVFQIVPTVVQVATLPEPTHDAAAGFINRHLYVFGGGQAASYPYVSRVSGSSATHIANLARPLSDAVAVPFHSRGKQGLALLGGYDGSVFNTAVQFYMEAANGTLTSAPLFQLHTGVRYTAAAVEKDKLYIAGGLTASGAPSAAIDEWSATDGLKTIGKLPTAVQKAAAFVWQDNLIIAGGFDQNNQPLQEIWDFNTTTHNLRQVGKLPIPLADMGYVQNGNIGYLAGGSTANGLSSTLYRVRL